MACGLSNLGATGFLNVALQLLFRLRPVRQAVAAWPLDASDAPEFNPPLQLQLLFSAMAAAIAERGASSTSLCVSTAPLVMSFGWRNSHLQLGQDAYVMLEALLLLLRHTCALAGQPDVVVDTFGGRLLQTRTYAPAISSSNGGCTRRSRVPTQEQLHHPFVLLSLPLAAPVSCNGGLIGSLDEALAGYMAPQLHAGEPAPRRSLRRQHDGTRAPAFDGSSSSSSSSSGRGSSSSSGSEDDTADDGRALNEPTAAAAAALQLPSSTRVLLFRDLRLCAAPRVLLLHLDRSRWDDRAGEHAYLKHTCTFPRHLSLDSLSAAPPLPPAALLSRELGRLPPPLLPPHHSPPPCCLGVGHHGGAQQQTEQHAPGPSKLHQQQPASLDYVLAGVVSLMSLPGQSLRRYCAFIQQQHQQQHVPAAGVTAAPQQQYMPQQGVCSRCCCVSSLHTTHWWRAYNDQVEAVPSAEAVEAQFGLSSSSGGSRGAGGSCLCSPPARIVTSCRGSDGEEADSTACLLAYVRRDAWHDIMQDDEVQQPLCSGSAGASGWGVQHQAAGPVGTAPANVMPAASAGTARYCRTKRSRTSLVQLGDSSTSSGDDWDDELEDGDAGGARKNTLLCVSHYYLLLHQRGFYGETGEDDWGHAAELLGHMQMLVHAQEALA